MLGIFLLFAATICTGIFYFLSRQKNQSQPVNRYRKRNKNIRAQIMRSVQSYSTMRPAVETSSTIVSDTKAAELEQDVLMEEGSQQDILHDEHDHHEHEMDADEILGLKKQEKINKETNASVEKVERERIEKSLYEKSSDVLMQSRPVTRKADCIISFYLVAPENCVYAGYELLQALLSAGLRFGQNRIFHRHTHKDGRGDILFHCASATEPGTFDLTKMGAFTSRGLCLFFSADAVEDPMRTFDYLLETLDQLVDDLGGQVLDEHREVLTREKMIHCRQRIRAFENSKTTADMFD